VRRAPRLVLIGSTNGEVSRMANDLIAELRAIAEAHDRTMGDLAELCWSVAQQDADEYEASQGT